MQSFCSCVVMLLAKSMNKMWYHCRFKRKIYGTPL